MGSPLFRAVSPRLDLQSVVAQLKEARREWRQKTNRTAAGPRREFPTREELRQVMVALAAALFPMRLGPAQLRRDEEDAFVHQQLSIAVDGLQQALMLEFARSTPKYSIEEVLGFFIGQLPNVRRLLDSDAEAAYRGDPAAHNIDEVLLCYPGPQAMLHHRCANLLYQKEAYLVSRMISELAHSETGIDIHPGATIGEGFFIDHGTGVVIGETTIIGNHVRLYQTVTLGALSFPENQDGTLVKGRPRHPIVEDDVVIYAGTTILGRVTIGAGSIIGGNLWITQDVPPGTRVSQAHHARQSDPC